VAGGRFGRDPELLPGWYEEWVLDEQDRLRAQRVRHYAGTAQYLLEAGELHKAADFASRALAVDPLDEWALEVLVRANLGCGALCAAQRALATFRRQLHGEFGQLPSPLLEQLQRLATVPAASTGARTTARASASTTASPAAVPAPLRWTGRVAAGRSGPEG